MRSAETLLLVGVLLVHFSGVACAVEVFVLDSDFSDEHGHGYLVQELILEQFDNKNSIHPIDVEDILSDRIDNLKVLEALLTILLFMEEHPEEKVVINMSWVCDKDMPSVHAFIKELYKKGVIIVAAAGNDDTDTPQYPTSYKEVIGVGSVLRILKHEILRIPEYEILEYKKADYSNYGVNAEVYAEDILGIIAQNLFSSLREWEKDIVDRHAFIRMMRWTHGIDASAFVDMADKAIILLLTSLGEENIEKDSIVKEISRIRREHRLEPKQEKLLSQLEGVFSVELSGTSFAAPQIAGLTARIWEENPELTGNEIRRVIGDIADDLGGQFRLNVIKLENITSLWKAKESVTKIILDKMENAPVEELIDLLDDRRIQVREKASNMLVIRGREVVLELLARLENGSGANRTVIVDVLGRISDERAVGVLVSLLGDKTVSVRRSAEEALASFGSPAVEALIPELGSEESSIRESAARVIGEIRREGTADYLVPLLVDEETSVRLAAVQAIDKIGDEGFATPLVILLGDEVESVRLASEEALINIGSPSIKALVPVLNSEESRIRKAAARIIGEIGDETAAGYLVGLSADEEVSVRFTAVCALDKIAARITGKTGHESIVGYIVPFLADEEASVRLAAVQAVEQMGAETILQSLIPLLKDTVPSIRKTAARALGNTLDDEAVEPLTTALKDSSSEVREAAVVSLGRIGSQEAAQHIVRVLEDDEHDLRKAAAHALSALGWKPYSAKEKVMYLLVKQEWDAIDEMGEQDTAALIDLYFDSNWKKHQYSIIAFLRRIGGPATEHIIGKVREWEGDDMRQAQCKEYTLLLRTVDGRAFKAYERDKAEEKVFVTLNFLLCVVIAVIILSTLLLISIVLLVQRLT